MKMKMMMIAALCAALTTTYSCSNHPQSSNSGSVARLGNAEGNAANTTDAVPVKQVLSVDDVLSQADSLVNQTLTLEGICTHTCKHGATKMFVMGSDDTQTLRIEAASLGAFDTRCIHSLVTITGIVREQRIDEAYLQQWEARLKAQTAPAHGETAAGCATEKKAHGETANTPEARMADFRQRIAARRAATGKDYLSFYYVEATAYDIAE